VEQRDAVNKKSRGGEREREKGGRKKGVVADGVRPTKEDEDFMMKKKQAAKTKSCATISLCLLK
jgi:hypothetical protein